ncbi:MAG: metal-dependent hydrolase [Haloferacaceae archaeon]
MMLPTHALAGMLLALPVAAVAPEYAPAALAAGFVGGVLPDLDLYAGHRKTLHFPTYYAVLGAGGLVAAALSPSTTSVAAAVLLLAAALHSVSDVFGGGLELRPWEATSERAVYDHVRGRWLAPKRWIRYDGAPEDLALSVGLAAALWTSVDGTLRLAVGGALAVAVVYAATRRVLPRLAELLVGRVLAVYAPASLVAAIPERYLGEGSPVTTAARTGVAGTRGGSTGGSTDESV